MKLRNKKMGKVFDVESLGHAESLKEKNGYQVTLSWATEYENLSQCRTYKSLAELNEEWEDYKPAEPLIKDKKIRKAVRAWAEANGRDTFKIINEHFNNCRVVGFTENGIPSKSMIEFSTTISGVERDCYYTIAELCGEEEEC